MNYDYRLLSFCDWSVPVNIPSKEKMARAGFVYAGDIKNVHRVYCTFCKIQIWKWSADMDPIRQHELANKWCPYLKFIADPRVKHALQYGYPENVTLKIYKKYHHYSQTNEDFVNLIRNYKPFKSIEHIICLSCYDNYRNVVYLPCAHLCLCNACAKNEKFCPVCHYKPLSKLELQ